jgi:hypothetical protein
LAGKSERELAAELKCSRSTVTYWVRTAIKPELAAHAKIELGEELAKVQLLESQAWRAFEKTGRQSFLTTIAWCCDYRARVGALVVQRHSIEHGGGIRVCGQRPDQFDEETVGLILQRIEDRRAYHAQVNLREHPETLI